MFYVNVYNSLKIVLILFVIVVEIQYTFTAIFKICSYLNIFKNISIEKNYRH